MKQITFKKAFAIIFICALCASYFLLKEGKQNFSDLTSSNIIYIEYLQFTILWYKYELF